MTNEEAIKIIKKYDVNGCGYCHQGGDEVEEAFQMAINALSEEKTASAEQTYGWCKGCKEYDTEKHCCHRYSSFIRESLQDSINAVLEDIKADIAEEICLTDNPYTKQTEYTISHKKVLEIIDKHISGKEEE